jgi:hypothetical protein
MFLLILVTVTRMCESIREFTIVGHQNQAFAFEIQPPYRINIARYIHQFANWPAPVAFFSFNRG